MYVMYNTPLDKSSPNLFGADSQSPFCGDIFPPPQSEHFPSPLGKMRARTMLAYLITEKQVEEFLLVGLEQVSVSDLSIQQCKRP